MRTRLRRNGAAPALLVAGTILAVLAEAKADSAIGTGSVPANQLNPSGLQPGLAIDPRGMSQLLSPSRSPTGLLYPKPIVYPEMIRSDETSDWWHAAWVDLGYLGGSERQPASFAEYGDWSAGPVASFGFTAENRANANFVAGRAGSIGRDDQFYELSFGRYGLLNLRIFYDAAPQLIATNAKILWQGAGSANLTLPDGLVPGASTAAAVEAAFGATPESKLTVTRTKTGMNGHYTPFDNWEIFFGLSGEWRDGRRAIGSAFSFPGRGAAELVQPVEYQTVDLTAGLRFSGETVEASLAYASSFFRNSHPALTWENPGLGAPAGSFRLAQGRIALAPDNDYHTLKGDLAWALTDLRIVASASYSRMLQDDALLPPVVNSGFAPVDLGSWNTIAALSRGSAKAAVDVIDAFAQAQASVAPDIRLTFETRYRDEDNDTQYLAFNPITGEYGYMGLDGALSRIYTPATAGSDVPIRNIPFATDRFDLTAKADYRWRPRTRVSIALAHKETEREHREVSQSRDDVLEAQVNTTQDWGTARLSYELAARSGSDYVSDPYRFARSVSLPGYVPRAGGDTPYALRSLLKYDVAQRTEHAVKLQTNYILSARSDVQVSGSYRTADYGAEYGQRRTQTYDLHASFTRQFADATSITVYYGYQSHDRDVAAINVVRGPGSDDTAGGPNYPLSNMWRESANDANHAAGATLDHAIGPVTLDLSYSFVFAKSRLTYAYASSGAISPGLTPTDAGAGFPPQDFSNHLFEAGVVWPYQTNILLRAYYRLEHEALDDFHYEGLRNVIGNHIFLGDVPEDYTVHIIGAFTQWRF